MRSQALDKAHRRIAWIRIGGLLVCALLAGRAAHLTVYHDRAVELFEQQIHTEKRLTAARGAIVDREGRELALTIRSASVYAVPKEMKDRGETARIVAETLGLERGTIARRLGERERFTYLARWIDPEKAEALRKLELPGIGVEAEPRRSYPAGALAASLIGFADIDGKGVRGVEQIENTWLSGRAQTVAVERDAKGRALALDPADPREVEGGEIALALDAAMQGAAEIALAETVEKHDAKGGIVLTLDPKTGDVLALAEAPGFDPNEFRKLDYETTRRGRPSSSSPPRRRR